MRIEDLRAGMAAVTVLRAGLWPDHAWSMHAMVMEALEEADFSVFPEYRIVSHWPHISGRIDIVCEREGGHVAIELDTRKPRQKSIAKLRAFPGYRLIGLRGIEKTPCPDGITAVVGMAVRAATWAELADRRTVNRPRAA